MIEYSFSTVFIAVVATNILLILLTIFFRSKKIMVNAGYKLLALFIGFTVLRFVLPFELPFTITVLLPESVSKVITWIRHPFYTYGDFKISPWRLCEIVWVIGFLINLVLYIRDHRKTKYFLLANSLDATGQEPYHSLLEGICKVRNKKNRFKVMTVSGIQTPMVYGAFFPSILIPENMELSPESLYYTLVHETSHHFHHDLLIKKAIKFITMVYWWNPVCYLLNKKVDVILEMRVDNALTASNEQIIVDYLHCLYEIGEQSLEENGLSKAVTISFLGDPDGELTKRTQMLLSVNQKKNWPLNIVLFVLIVGIYVLSHLFIFEAHYARPEEAGDTAALTESNTYAVLKEDGTYDIYFSTYFLENTDTLEYYSSDIPIYTEEEITNEKD